MADELFDIDFSSLSSEEKDGISLTDINTEIIEAATTGEGVVVTDEGDTAAQTAVPAKVTKEVEAEAETIELGPDGEPLNKTVSTGGAAEESEEEEGEPEAEATKNTKSPGTDGKSSPVTPFASFLQEKGFLPNMDIEEIKKAEDPITALADAWGKEVQIMQQQLISAFPPEMIEMAKAVANGVPFDALKNDKIQEINYSKITEQQVEENADLQKRLVAEYLTAKGFKETKIKSLVNTYEDSGTLNDEAKEALGEMKELFKQRQEQVKQQYAIQQKQFEEQHLQRIKTIKDTIEKTEEIVPSMALTKKAKEDLFNNMTQIVGHDAQGNPVPYIMALRQEDPLKFDMAVTYLAQTTKGFTDWSKLSNTAKTSAAKQLEKALETTPVRTGGASKKVVNAEGAEANLMKSLESMFNM